MRPLLALVLSLSVAGCGGSTDKPTSSSGDKTPSTDGSAGADGSDTSGNTGIFAGCGMYYGSVQPQEPGSDCIEAYGPLNANFPVTSQDHCSTDSIACFCMYKWGSGNCDYQASYGSCSEAVIHQNQIGMCTTFTNYTQ